MEREACFFTVLRSDGGQSKPPSAVTNDITLTQQSLFAVRIGGEIFQSDAAGAIYLSGESPSLPVKKILTLRRPQRGYSMENPRNSVCKVTKKKFWNCVFV